jgi:hypothetical protein
MRGIDVPSCSIRLPRAGEEAAHRVRLPIERFGELRDPNGAGHAPALPSEREIRPIREFLLRFRPLARRAPFRAIRRMASLAATSYCSLLAGGVVGLDTPGRDGPFGEPGLTSSMPPLGGRNRGGVCVALAGVQLSYVVCFSV